MKYLVTGNLGFIGMNLRNYLPLEKTVGWDLTHNRDIFSNHFEEEVEAADVVIHLAALTSVNMSFKYPKDTFRVNILGTARVVELCDKYKKKLIYPSSAAIYHPELSPYAMSKKLAEDIVVSMMPKNKFTVLRLFNVFGDYMNPDSGSIMYNFLHSNPITIYGDGESTRDFINVKDVCMIMKEAVHSKWNGKVVDVGTSQAYSTNYIAGLFAHYKNVKIVYKEPKREIRWSIADTSKLEILYSKNLVTNVEMDIQNLCLHQ